MNVIARIPAQGFTSFQEAVEHSQHKQGWQQRSNVTLQDIAEGVAFLCSDSAQFISGCILPYLFR